MTKVTLEVGDGQDAFVLRKGTSPWAAAQLAMGRKVERKILNDVRSLQWEALRDPGPEECEYRIAPPSPIGELIQALAEYEHSIGYGVRWDRWDRVRLARTAVEAELAKSIKR